jgi:hypothetical protein
MSSRRRRPGNVEFRACGRSAQFEFGAIASMPCTAFARARQPQSAAAKERIDCLDCRSASCNNSFSARIIGRAFESHFSFSR